MYIITNNNSVLIIIVEYIGQYFERRVTFGGKMIVKYASRD